MTPKFAFMGSPDISVPFLDLLHENGSDIIVFTRPDKVRSRGKRRTPTPVKKRALELGIPVYTCSTRSDEAVNILRDFAPDFLFVVAFGEILRRNILETPAIAPINVHFSLLPEYRGPTPVNSALLDGRTTTGTTVIVMNRKMDAGDIIYKEEVPLHPDDNASILFDRLTDQSVDLLKKNWEPFIRGDFTPVEQNGTPTHTSFISKRDRIIQWNVPATELHNRVRALTTYPGVRTHFRGKNVCLLKTQPVSESADAEPGTVVSVLQERMTVMCADRPVEILQLKPAGKRCLDIAAFISGYRPEEGEKFS